MARSFLAGSTDYSHQSLTDLKEDLNYWKGLCSERIKWIDNQISILESRNYWCKMPNIFQSEIYYSRKFFSTVFEEITLILSDLEFEVRENHITRLNRLANTADKENKDIGQTWHGDYDHYWKDYGNEDFAIVEEIYGRTRDLVASLTDLSNIAFRLKDFIGKMKTEESKSILNSAKFGDNITLTIGNNNIVTTTNIKIKQWSIEDLEKVLYENKVSKEDIEELKEILKTDKPNFESKTFGDGVSNWVGKMISKSAKNIWNIGIGAAGSLLAEALNQYYGWI